MNFPESKLSNATATPPGASNTSFETSWSIRSRVQAYSIARLNVRSSPRKLRTTEVCRSVLPTRMWVRSTQPILLEPRLWPTVPYCRLTLFLFYMVAATATAKVFEVIQTVHGTFTTLADACLHDSASALCSVCSHPPITFYSALQSVAVPPS